MEKTKYEKLFKKQEQYFHSVLKQERLYARKERLIKIKKWIKNNQSAIQTALYNDFKKSPEEVLISEIKPVISEINHALHSLRDWCKDKVVDTPLSLLGTKGKVVYQPKGVCLIIAPWNFPFMLAIGPIISAIAAGNSVVLKPSEMTPHTERLLNDMINELFLEENIAIVCGGVPETTALLQLPWNHIFFTGSPQVGKIVMQQAAKHLTSVTLELGGRNPTIITQKANLRDTAKKLSWGKFFNNGQSCVSPNFVLIDQKIKANFIEELKYEFVEMYGNLPKEIKKQPLTRIVNQHHFKRVKNLIETSIESGAKVVFGRQYDETQNYIAPTVLENISVEMPIFKEEIFGPVLPILTYSTLQEALSIIQKMETPLALYLFTTSKKEQKQILAQTRAGTTVINDTTLQFAHANLPFGGVGTSGMGKAHGYYGFLEFTNQRSVLKQRVGFTTSQFIYPKYNKLKRMIIKFITWAE